MKKFFAIALLAVMMLMMCSITAFAEVSPTAQPTPDDPNGPSDSPQTGDTAVLYTAGAIILAAAAGVVATKKIKE